MSRQLPMSGTRITQMQGNTDDYKFKISVQLAFENPFYQRSNKNKIRK